MYIEDIQEACRRVLKGDKEAEKQLELDTIKYDRSTPHNLSVRSLQATYNSVLTTAVAAKQLDLPFFEKQCELTMQLLQAIAQAKKVEFEHNIDAQDIAEVMLALIHDEASRHDYKEQPEEEEHSDENSTTTSPRAATAEQPTQTPVAATSIDQEQPSKAKDTDAQPPPTPAAATSSEQARPSKTKDVHKQPTPSPAAATPIEQELPSKANDADEQATPTSPAQGKCTAKDPYSSSRSKNKRRQCSLCPFFGTHLKRHVASKHTDAAQTKPERVTLVHLHDKFARQEQAKKPVSLYQCSLKNCGAIITRLGQHLTRVHKIHDQAKLKKIKSTCKRLPPASLCQPKQKGIKVSLQKPSKGPCHQKSNPSQSSTSSEDESFVSDGSTSQEHQEVDHHQLKVDADVDDISTFADSDKEKQDMSDTEEKKWADIYLAKDPTRSVREYFISRFYRYLLHAKGGAHSENQALINTR